MRPDFRAPRLSAGFGLVAALFLMIVVTVIIMTMAHLSAIQHGTSALLFSRHARTRPHERGLSGASLELWTTEPAQRVHPD